MTEGEALSSAFYIDGRRTRPAVARGGSFDAIHLATMFEVDLVVLHKLRWYEKGKWM